MAINQPRTFGEHIWILDIMEGLFYVMRVVECESIKELRAKLDPFVMWTICRTRHR